MEFVTAENMKRLCKAVSATNEVAVASIGMKKEEVDALKEERLFNAQECRAAKELIDNVVFASCDMCGINRYPAPAEIIAITIAEMVDQLNDMGVCAQFRQTATARSLSTNRQDMEQINPQQMYGLVTLARMEDTSLKQIANNKSKDAAKPKLN